MIADPADLFKGFLTSDIDVARPQTGQCKALAEAVAGDGTAVQFLTQCIDAGKGLLRIDDVGPDFVIHNPKVILIGQFRNNLQVFLAVQVAQRIMGITQADHFGFGGDVGFQIIQLPSAVFIDRRVAHRCRAGIADGNAEEQIHGVKNDCLITGLQNRSRHRMERSRRTVHGDDILRTHRNIVAHQFCIGKGLPQAGDALKGGIGEITALNVADHFLTDLLCRLKIRVRGSQRNHICGQSAPAHAAGSLAQNFKINFVMRKQVLIHT